MSAKNEEREMEGKQQELGIREERKVESVEGFKFDPIRGQPMLRWRGKRPFESTQYFPAQEKEIHGEEGPDGWMNEIYWGDNLQVMSHLLKKFRGRVNLIYIDPPFDSKAAARIPSSAITVRRRRQRTAHGDMRELN